MWGGPRNITAWGSCGKQLFFFLPINALTCSILSQNHMQNCKSFPLLLHPWEYSPASWDLHYFPIMQAGVGAGPGDCCPLITNGYNVLCYTLKQSYTSAPHFCFHKEMSSILFFWRDGGSKKTMVYSPFKLWNRPGPVLLLRGKGSDLVKGSWSWLGQKCLDHVICSIIFLLYGTH